MMDRGRRLQREAGRSPWLVAVLLILLSSATTRAQGRDPAVGCKTRVVHVRQILLFDDRNLAKVQTALAAGRPFFDIARQYTDEPGGRAKGGDLGWNCLDSFYREGALIGSLKPGQHTSEPFEGIYGKHFFELIESR
ncbi:hypothetical protein BH10PSE17_BH10PSE17_36450 [soil metagenome]